MIELFAVRTGLLVSLIVLNLGILSKFLGQRWNSEQLSHAARGSLIGGFVLILLVAVASVVWYNV